MIFVVSLYLHRQVAQREERRGEKIGGFICILHFMLLVLGNEGLFGVLKFNKHGSTFVLFDKKFSILD
jgi:hypothetical protein